LFISKGNSQSIFPNQVHVDFLLIPCRSTSWTRKREYVQGDDGYGEGIL